MKGIEKINYNVSKDNENKCMDACNYIIKHRVGSLGCQACDYHLLHNEFEHYIYCGYNGKLKKSENKIRIYLAGALFSIAEINYNIALKVHIENTIQNVIVFLPQDECKDLSLSKDIYNKCVEGVENSDVIVAVCEGTDVDSGTAFEIGMSKALKKPIILIRSDFRNRGDDFSYNLMLSQSADYLIQESSLYEIVKEIQSAIENIQEKMYGVK